jgi:O-antigen/teichoic acid export membrane protein
MTGLPFAGRLTMTQRTFLTGSLWVAGGTVLLGLSGYAFIALTPGRVSAADYAALSSLYLLMSLIGPGLFMPVEQETTRLVSRARALGQGTAAVVRQISTMSAVMLGIAVVVLLALYPTLVDHVFHGRPGLWFALVASTAGYAWANMLRGVLAGRGHLRAYGCVVGIDGLVRLIPAIVLAAAGVAAAAPYGLVLGSGSLAALALAIPLTRPPGPAGAPTAWSVLVPATSWLVAAQTLALAVANLGPVAVNALLPGDPGRVGVFAFVFVLARLPLFLLYGVQPLLLPVLSRSSARNDRAGLRRDLRRALLLVAGLGALALVLTAPVAGLIARSLFPGRPAISGTTITLLVVGTVLAMLVQVLQPALIAVANHRMVAGAWLIGAASFVVTFFLPLDAVARATTAQIVAGAATLAVMAFALRGHLRANPGGDEDVPAEAAV